VVFAEVMIGAPLISYLSSIATFNACCATVRCFLISPLLDSELEFIVRTAIIGKLYVATTHFLRVCPDRYYFDQRYTNCLIALFNNRVKEMKSQSAHGMQSERSQAHSRHNHNNSVKVHVVREMNMSFEGQMELGNLQVRADT
jgi:hypothetical protein